jgi:hypothetical protein
MIQPLAAGELVYVTDSQRLYIGNGSAMGGVQITGYQNEDAVDAVGAALIAGSHTGGISFAYGVIQDNANRIDATVNISQLLQNLNLNSYNITGTGNINTAGSLTITGNATVGGRIIGDFKGSIFGDDSSILVDAVSGAINLDGTVKGNVVPNYDTSHSLGAINKRFNSVFLSNTITLGSRTISLLNGNIDLPSGTTLGGDPLGAATLAGTNLNVNIIRDDSSTMVNASTGVVVGTFFGDLKGSVAGDDSTILIDGVSNTVGNMTATFKGKVLDATFEEFQILSTSTETLSVRNIIVGGGIVGGMNIKASNGSIVNPTNTEASDILGGYKFYGYRTGGYKFAAGVVTQWDSTADFASGIPKSTIALVSGSNTNTPHQATFNGNGVFTAPVIKAASYGNTSFPDNPERGWIIFDSTNNLFKGWNGTAWATLG